MDIPQIINNLTERYPMLKPLALISALIVLILIIEYTILF
jgi:hypothetical protein